MATNDNTPADDRSAPAVPKGRDVDTLGPSDSSDSGSDVQGERPMATEPDNPAELGALPVESGTNTDASGTGERGSATGNDPIAGADIRPDQIIERADTSPPDLPPDR